MALNSSIKESLLKQNMQRIVQLKPVIHKLINVINQEVSNVYDREETLKLAETLASTLGQMDSDVASLITLLND